MVMIGFLNGTKHFISGAAHADFVIVFVATGEDMTDKGLKNGSRVSWLIVAILGLKLPMDTIRYRIAAMITWC